MRLQVPTNVDQGFWIGDLGGSPYFINPSKWQKYAETMILDVPDDIVLADSFVGKVLSDESDEANN